MLLRIEHATHYAYTSPVRSAEHVAHLRPLDDAEQQVVAHALDVTPAPARIRRTRDTYGNERAFFSVAAEHASLQVAARSIVRTAARPTIAGDASWDEMRDSLCFERGRPYNPASEFTFASPYVPRHEDFLAYARASFPPGRSLLAACTHLMQRIHDEFRYEPHVTDAATPALDALRLRSGVCQDYAHVMVGCLRTLGVAARYVSGYLLTEAAAGQPQLVGADASHAWVEVHVPSPQGEPQWAGFDPTNARAPGEDYVVLARGRDYGDVAPLRGVLQGGAHHRMRVAVTVASIESPAFTSPPPGGKAPS